MRYQSPQVLTFSVIARGEASKQSISRKYRAIFWIAAAAGGRLAMTVSLPELLTVGMRGDRASALRIREFIDS